MNVVGDKGVKVKNHFVKRGGWGSEKRRACKFSSSRGN